MKGAEPYVGAEIVARNLSPSYSAKAISTIVAIAQGSEWRKVFPCLNSILRLYAGVGETGALLRRD